MLVRPTNDGDAWAIAQAEPLQKPLTFLRPRFMRGAKNLRFINQLKGNSYERKKVLDNCGVSSQAF